MFDEVYSLVHDKNVTMDHIQLYFEEQDKQLAIEPYFDHEKIEIIDRNVLQAIVDAEYVVLMKYGLITGPDENKEN